MKAFHLAFLWTLFLNVVIGQQTLNNESIMKLAKAGMGDDLIVNMVNTQPGSYSLGTDELIMLKQVGVSEKVIGAMVLKSSGAPSPGITTTVTPVAGPVSEVGIYYKQTGSWVDLNPEGVSFKTGGVLKSIATDGIVKGDVNGHIAGEHSKTQLKTPIELLIYAPEGIASTEYQLLHLHESGKAREFRTVTGGVFHKSGGASRDAIEFEAKKIAPRTFVITLSGLKTGEYGLLPPASGDGTGTSGRLGKLYTFHVIE